VGAVIRLKIGGYKKTADPRPRKWGPTPRSVNPGTGAARDRGKNRISSARPHDSKSTTEASRCKELWLQSPGWVSRWRLKVLQGRTWTTEVKKERLKRSCTRRNEWRETALDSESQVWAAGWVKEGQVLARASETGRVKPSFLSGAEYDSKSKTVTKKSLESRHNKKKEEKRERAIQTRST